MLGEIVTTPHGQLGAYIGPHAAELPSFTGPADLRDTYRRLSQRHIDKTEEIVTLLFRMDKLEYMSLSAVSAHGRMEI